MVKWRSVLVSVHRWVGIIAGAYMVVVATTGAALVFRIDIQRAVYPRLFSPRSDGPHADILAVMESVRTAYPAHVLSGVDAPTDARPTFLAYVTRGTQFATVLVDPVSARVLGELPSQGFVQWLQDLHFNLLAGRTGRTVNGIGAACLLLMCATGPIVWWPGRFGIHFTRNLTRVSRDVHDTVGILSAAFLALWAVTGLSFAFPTQFRAAVNWVSPITATRAPTSDRSFTGTRLEWPALIERARTHVPGQHVARVVLPARDRDTVLVMFSTNAPTPAAGATLTSVYLDQFSGRLVGEQTVASRTVGDTVMAWTAPLHIGNFAGRSVRFVWAVVGLAPACLAVTGFVTWWRRERRAT